MLNPHNVIHMHVDLKLAGWHRIWGRPNFDWNMIIYSMRLQLRLRACSWISMNLDDMKSEANTQLHGPVRNSGLQKEHARSFYALLNMPFRFMSHPQFRVQTVLSAHKRIQNHSLQFPAKLSIRKMKPWFELFKYSLWSAGWSHKLSTCCVNWGVTVENGSKNRTATRWNQGMSKQTEKAGKLCVLSTMKNSIDEPMKEFWLIFFSAVYVSSFEHELVLVL